MLTLNKNSPHYFSFRSKPVLLIGSGEHYGAVLNKAFDYHAYLGAVANARLNLTRTFSGTYREIPGEFGIEDNMLAPKPEDFLCPWVQRANGKFDLEQFDPAYFARLRDFMQVASDKGIIVEFVLFCFWYNAPLWQYSPMHPDNNVQGIGPRELATVYAANSVLLPIHEALARKFAIELNGYDNFYYEICNEVYSRHDGTDDRAWQTRIARTIVEAESELPRQHLIAMNLQNRAQRVVGLPSDVSIINFHYAQPEAVYLNYHLDLPVVDDETGFLGQRASPYRQEAWNFMLSGGAGVSHLDYSFTLTHPSGTAPIIGNTPGYGGPDLRAQLSFLRSVLEEIEIWRMQPQGELLAWRTGPTTGRGMAEIGHRYAVYLSDTGFREDIGLGLPAGRYEARWLDPIACLTISTDTLLHNGGYTFLKLPTNRQELVLILRRTP